MTATTAPLPQMERKRGVLGRIVVLALAVVTFIGATVLGVLLHLNLPVARRNIVATTNAIIGSLFQGKITIENLDSVGLFGLDGARVRITDPSGVQVIYAQGVSARYSVLELGTSLLFGKGDIDIQVVEASIDYADVNLDADASGALRLERTFAAPPASGTQAPQPAAPGGRGVTFAVREGAVKHAWVHGQMHGAPHLDAEVDALRGKVLVTPAHIALDAPRFTFKLGSMARGLNPEGLVQGRLDLPSSTGRYLGGEVSFTGAVGGVPATAHGTLDGDHIEAAVDVPQVEADRIRALLPEAPIYDKASAHVEAHGDLPRLEAKAHATLGEGTADVVGTVTLADEIRAELQLDATRVDAQAFSPTTAHSVLGAKAKATLTIARDGSVSSELSGETLRGMFDSNVVPPATFRGTFRQNAQAANGSSGTTVRATAVVMEEGAPIDVTIDLHPSGASSVVDVTAKASVPRLDRIARIGKVAEGRATLLATGRIFLADKSLDATVDSDLDDVQIGPVSIARAHIKARATGPLATPHLGSMLTATGIDVNGLTFASGRAAVEGPLTAQAVSVTLEGTNAPNIQGNARIETGAATTIRAARVSVSRDQVTLLALVDFVRIAKGDVRVDGALIEGIGAPVHASVHDTPAEIAIRADCMGTGGVDLKRLAHLLRVTDKVREGRLAFDVDTVIRKKGGVTGRVVFDLEHGSFLDVDDGSAHIDANMKGRRFFANVHASLGTVFEGYVNTDTLEIGGQGPLELASWKTASGKVNLDGRVDLAKLEALLPKGTLPFTELGGELLVEGSYDRSSVTDDTPVFDISMATHGLIARKDRLRTSGLDVQVDAKLNGETHLAGLTTRLVDKEGLIVSLEMKANAFPYTDLFESAEIAIQRMERVPFAAKLVIPRRKLDDLPPLLQMDEARGEVEATVDIVGTALDPKIELVAKGYDVKSFEAPVSTPLGADIVAHYDGQNGNVRIKLAARRTEVLDADVRFKASVGDALLHPSEELPWEASTHLRVTGLQLGSISALGDRQIRGKLSGELALLDLHKNARANADLRVADLKIAGAKYTGATLSLVTGDHTFSGSARIQQADGFAEAKARVGIDWGTKIAPVLDETQRVSASIAATGFRAAALLPFVEGAVSELDGRIDAAASIEIDANGQNPKMQGTVTFTEGVVQVPDLGDEFHGVKAKLVMTPDGVIRLEDATAYGITGMVMAKGAARMDGLKFLGANAAVTIPRSAPIPIDIQGTPMGDAFGELAIKVDTSEDANSKTVNVAVDVPVLQVRLPLTSSHEVQQLDAVPNAHIGVLRRGEFVVLPMAGADLTEKAPETGKPTTLNVAINLGNEVDVRRGNSLKVQLEGNPLIRITDRTHVSGQIRLKSGILDVKGKRFEIEKGTVTFVGDASNPLVVVTAGWPAPGGIRVYADFVGPLKTGKLTLRSEPARPKNEILALILFGSTDGATSASYTNNAKGFDGANTAGSYAGGFATEGLNRGLDQLTGLEVTTKIDTSAAGNPRPEVEVQIARDLSIQIAYVLGTPPPGTTPDTTFATIDWRFKANWSLETTFGNRGSTIADLIWQYRY